MVIDPKGFVARENISSVTTLFVIPEGKLVTLFASHSPFVSNVGLLAKRFGNTLPPFHSNMWAARVEDRLGDFPREVAAPSIQGFSGRFPEGCVIAVANRRLQC